MIPELRSLEPQLKQILYGCVEHVQATKAALYLSVSHDLNEKKYELVTHYQYNPADRKVISANDDLVDRLSVKRSPFFVNGLGADQRFAEMLFRQGNDRLLVAPLFSRGRMVGFIDMRDKAGKKPFDNPDVQAAQKIAEQMISVLAKNKLFGLPPLSVVSDAPQHLYAAAAASEAPAIASPRAVLQPGQVFSSDATRAIEAARQYLSKRQHVTNSGKRNLTDAAIDIAKVILPAALGTPHAMIACLSAVGQVTNPQSTAARSTVGDDAIELVHAHLQAGLKRLNKPHLTRRGQILYPFGVQPAPVTASSISALVSAPVNPQSVQGLILTVAFERATDEQARAALQIFLSQMEPVVEAAIAASGRGDRYLIAERLLEPDFHKYPELAEHSRDVAAIAQRFALHLELPSTQVETVRIAALVHDVGLRLLDYERMYNKANLTAEEMRGLAEHPVVGAALVEPLLGQDVAQSVLRHHERVDGKGYPSRLSGAQIPLPSRIIQIVDAWVAMTTHQTYQPAIPREKAVASIREAAGSQFDAALVERFVAALPDIIQ
jgi:HD domain/GAF domain